MEKLTQLLSPISAGTFFDEYFRKAPLFIPENKDFDEILTTEEINDYFNNPSLLYPYVRIVGNGNEIDLKQYQLVGSDGFNILNKEHFFRLFSEGNTLVIQGAQYQFKNLQRLVSALEEELKLEINANIYITPSGSKGFFPHFDLHEVLVLQINGTKSWNIYHDIPVEAPIKGTIPAVSREHFVQTGPQHQLKLQPGDVLYVPRGVVHEAFCEEEPSIHITLGFNPLLRIDIMAQLLKKLEEDPYFRETFSTLQPSFDPSAAATEMADKAGAVLKDLVNKLPAYEANKMKYNTSRDKFGILFGVDNLGEDDIPQISVEIMQEPPHSSADESTPLLEYLKGNNNLTAYMEQENVPLPILKNRLKTLLKKEAIRLQF